MAQALGNLTQVEVYMRTYSPTMSDKIVEKIIGQDLSFNFKGKNTPAIFFIIRFCIALIFKSRTKNIVYTRSLVVSLISQTLGFQSGVELHQDRLSTSYFLNHFFGYLLRRPFFNRRLSVIVISDALKSIIYKKYGVISDVKVLHDAAVPPDKKLLSLPKRERPLIVYTGKLENERSVDKLVDMAAAFPMCDFRLIGGNREQVGYYRLMAKQKGVINIRIFLRQGYRRISYFQCKADILIAFWSVNVPTMKYCSPLKLFEYMQTGNAVMVHNFPVLHEVLPFNPLISLIDPVSMADAEKALNNLLQTEFQPSTREQLRDYGNRFSYAARAGSLLEIFASIKYKNLP